MICPGCERTILDFQLSCPNCGMIFSREIPMPLFGPNDIEPQEEATSQETETELAKPPDEGGPVEAPRHGLTPGEPGRYTVLRKIGSGGMGTVYKIYDHKIERFSAMKRLSPDRADPNGIQRFFIEAKAIAKLSHPNIVTIFDINEDSRGFFILMEYIRGISLRAWVRRFGALAPALGLDILRQVADSLACAHRSGVIHRDVKPSNILVAQKLHPKLLDFGVALIAGEEARSGGRRRVAGTQGYMAPEQRWKGRPADERSDVYAFCMTLVEVMVGQKPWLVRRVPPELEDFVRKGTQQDPRRRFQNMDEVLDALDDLLEHFTEEEEEVPAPIFERIASPKPRQEYFLAQGERQRRYPLRQSVTYVGRSDEDADIVLPDKEVSRRHVKVVRSGYDTYIFDLQSRNGITLDDKLVSAARLRDGTVIILGNTRLEFHVET
jgi:serine/threonine protein kinase